MKTITINEAIKTLEKAYAVSVRVEGNEREELTFPEINADTENRWSEFMWLVLEADFLRFFVDQNNDIRVKDNSMWLTDSDGRLVCVKVLTLKSLK